MKRSQNTSALPAGLADTNALARREPSPRIAAETPYLPDAIEHYHHFTLVGMLGGMGRIWLDPNRRGAAARGEPPGTAARDVAERRVRIVKKSWAESQSQRLYVVRGALLGPLHLVVPCGEGEPFHFVYHDRAAGAPRTVALERLEWSEDPATDGRSSIVYGAGHYTAQQFPDFSLLIAAHGWHPTSGYKVFIEEAPQFYPPEFRFLQIKPTELETPILSRFSAQVRVAAFGAIERVAIRDDHGRHELDVEQVREDEFA